MKQHTGQITAEDEMVTVEIWKDKTVELPLSIVEEAMMEGGYDNVAQYLELTPHYHKQTLYMKYTQDLLTWEQRRAFANQWVINDLEFLIVEDVLTIDRKTFQSLYDYAFSYKTKSAIVRDFGNEYDHIIGEKQTDGGEEQ